MAMALESAEGRAMLPKGTALGAGLVAGPRADDSKLPPSLEWFDASHPSPNALSEAAGRRALALAEERRSRGGLIVLLSGGASSMLAVPAAGLSLADKMRDRKSTRLNSSHQSTSRMPSSA